VKKKKRDPPPRVIWCGVGMFRRSRHVQGCQPSPPYIAEKAVAGDHALPDALGEYRSISEFECLKGNTVAGTGQLGIKSTNRRLGPPGGSDHRTGGSGHRPQPRRAMAKGRRGKSAILEIATPSSPRRTGQTDRRKALGIEMPTSPSASVPRASTPMVSASASGIVVSQCGSSLQGAMASLMTIPCARYFELNVGRTRPWRSNATRKHASPGHVGLPDCSIPAKQAFNP